VSDTLPALTGKCGRQLSRLQPKKPMRKTEPTNRQFFAATIVTVGAFCFWPNWLTGLFALGTILSWIFFDVHSFSRAVWRTVLLSSIIIGITYAGLWIASPPAALTNQIPLQFGGASAVVLLSLLGLVRSILNARKDCTR
jgi:hypothetical protein